MTSSSLRVHANLILHLTLAEFARRRSQSFGGVVWMVVVPFATIVTIYTALDYGLGMRALLGPGFGHTLVAALLPWLFFADALSNATTAVTSQPHLVKKVRFPVLLLPMAAVLVAALTHLMVAAGVVAFLWAAGAAPGWNALFLPYFLVIAVLLALAFGTLLAGLNVFLPDVGQVLPAVVGLWFWLTPIVWPLQRIPADWQYVAFFNPMTLVVTGYGSALADAPLPVEVAYLPLFALLTLGFCAACLYSFSRMQHAFADSL